MYSTLKVADTKIEIVLSWFGPKSALLNLRHSVIPSAENDVKLLPHFIGIAIDDPITFSVIASGTTKLSI